MATTPDLIAPDDAVTARLQSLVFSWEPVTPSAPDTYVLQIARDEAFTDIETQVETTLTIWEATFTAGDFYYWRVLALDGATVLPSSTVRSFSAPSFSPAAVETHIEDGKGRLLNQFLEGN
jgi:hypothetical protein